jgi:hypothetical protein
MPWNPTRWFSRGDPGANRRRIAALEHELEEAARELSENRWLMSQWQQELARARGGTSQHVDDAVTAKLGWLLRDLALPLVEMEAATAAGEEGRAARAAFERLVATLAPYRVALEGAVGQVVQFDLDLHAADEPDIAAGARVRVVQAGVCVAGEVVLKARVQRDA